MNNCVNVSTVGILDLLENLNLLGRIEANKGQNSTVQQAFAILDSEDQYSKKEDSENDVPEFKTFPKIVDFLFRNPRSGIETIAKFCPNLNKVQIQISALIIKKFQIIVCKRNHD